MFAFILTLTAHADEPVAPAAEEKTEEKAPLNIGTIVLTGEVAVPEVVVFTPRVESQESSPQAIEALIDARIEEAAARK